MEKISIIIPIYNAENFLKQCIDSVIHQSYKNLEIILVDDGSTDSCGKICDDYAMTDSRIKVIHQKNGGVAVARNAGMDTATGKYIMFLDADDFYEMNSCEIFYNEIEKRNADLVVGNYIHTTYDGVKWEQPLYDINLYDHFKLSITDYQKSFYVINSIVVNKIFKREFLETYHTRFIPSALAEDAIFMTFCYVHTNNSYYIKDIIYNYRQSKENTSISTSCSKAYFENLNESYKKIFHNFESTNNIGFYRFFYARIMPYLLCKIIDTNSLSDEEILSVVKMFDWFFKQRESFRVAVIEDRLSNIVDCINHEAYQDALISIKETKEYRKSLSDEKKEKMYAPSKELFKRMSE